MLPATGTLQARIFNRYISPLISLITDQIRAMNEIGVEARNMTSNQIDQQTVMNHLFDLRPQGQTKLLYVTPEKIAMSEGLSMIMMNLYDRNLISR